MDCVAFHATPPMATNPGGGGGAEGGPCDYLLMAGLGNLPLLQNRTEQSGECSPLHDRSKDSFSSYDSEAQAKRAELMDKGSQCYLRLMLCWSGQRQVLCGMG